MAKLILHIGSHKTGSSSIQQVLAETLKPSRRAKILYPEAGRDPGWPYAHHALAKHLGKHDGLPGPLDREVRGFKGDTVIISCENLFHWSALDKFSAFDQSGLFDEIEIILYLRRPDMFFESWYGESVRRGTTLHFPERFWLDELDYFRIEPRVDHLNKVLPDAKITVRSYDLANAKEHGAVGDFCGLIGLEVPDLGPDFLQSNRSLPATGTAALLYANQRLQYAEDSNGLQKLRKLFYDMEKVFPKSELGLIGGGLRREILNAMRYDAHVTLQKCGIDMPLYEFFPDYDVRFADTEDVFSNKKDMAPIYDALAPVLALLAFNLK